MMMLNQIRILFVWLRTNVHSSIFRIEFFPSETFSLVRVYMSTCGDTNEHRQLILFWSQIPFSKIIYINKNVVDNVMLEPEKTTHIPQVTLIVLSHKVTCISNRPHRISVRVESINMCDLRQHWFHCRYKFNYHGWCDRAHGWQTILLTIKETYAYI
jgi:hypothetical protein